MRKIKEILRLRFEAGLGLRAIARSVGVASSTVWEYLDRAAKGGVGWPWPEGADEGAIETRLFPSGQASRSPVEDKAVPDWAAVHLERKRPYVTLQLLWEEYRSEHPKGYGYSRFCELYQRWAKKLNPTMRQVHRAGHRMFSDYSGGTIDLVNSQTGEQTPVKLFLAVLGASNYTYAEPSLSETLPEWVGSHIRAFEYFDGVTEILVPDNLRSGITRPCRYDPDVNPTFQEMAAYYGTCVIPARVRKPRDKAKVEVGVLIAERWILARLRNRTFHTMSELRQAIAELLENLNDREMKKIGRSRRQVWEDIERHHLNPLPAVPYEIAEWKKARVNIDYHIEFKRHYYSVAYRLVREEVDVRATARVVEIFSRGKRVASHPRSWKRGGHTTQKEHMPQSHRAYLDWSPSRLLRWASTLGPHTEKLAEEILERRFHPEQGYRACLGIFRLGKRFGPERLEKACQRAVALGLYRYKSVESILKQGLENHPLPNRQVELTPLPWHENLRGSDYYREETPPC